MIQKISSAGRAWARRHLLSPNTIRYRVEFPRILDAFKIIGKQGSVFDGGAGSGQMLRQVYEAGYCERGFAMEYDPSLYAILQRNYADVPALQCGPGSLLEVKQAGESFDCAMSTQVLEHIEDHVLAASELGRIVKRGGHLVVSVPHPPEPYPNEGHVREGYTQDDLIALFPADKFKLLHTSYFLTRPTVDRALNLHKLPFEGKFVPVAWADLETHLTDEDRKAQIPFGILCLFQKL